MIKFVFTASILLYCFVSYRGEDSKEQEKTKYLFVGAEKCASVCHNNEKMGYQFKIWNSSPHKDALHKISKFNFREDSARILHKRPKVTTPKEPFFGQF